MDQYRPTGFRILPPVVKNLLIINVVFFVATILFDQVFRVDLSDYLGLHYFAAEKFRPYQFITYMFMHGGFAHIFFNMFALWMFGNTLENVWGPQRFLTYYIITGVGAALTHYIILYFQIQPTVDQLNAVIANPDVNTLASFISNHKFQINEYSGAIWNGFGKFRNDVTILQFDPKNHDALQGAINFLSEYKEYYLNLPNVVGASGAVFGLLLAFGMMFPNTLIYLYFAIPIRAKWFVILYGAIELYMGLSGRETNVAHFAHLGGMFFGFFLILYWNKKNDRNIY